MIEEPQKDNTEYIDENFEYELEYLNKIGVNIESDDIKIIEEALADVHDVYDNIINETIKSLKSENHNTKNIPTDITIARTSVLENNKDKAFESYSRVIEKDENNIEALYFMAYYNKSLGNDKEAISLFLRLINLGVVNTCVYENMAMIDKEKSREYFLKAIDIYNNVDVNYYHLKRIIYIILDRYKNGDYEIAYKYAITAVLISDNDFLYNLTGCVCYKMKYYDDALSSFYNAISMESRLNSRVLCNIAYCYTHKGSKRLADNYLKTAWKHADKKDEKLLFAIAEGYMLNENYMFAKIFFNKVLEANGNSTRAKEILEKIEHIETEITKEK